jgi:RNase P subunit RPR2
MSKITDDPRHLVTAEELAERKKREAEQEAIAEQEAREKREAEERAKEEAAKERAKEEAVKKGLCPNCSTPYRSIPLIDVISEKDMNKGARTMHVIGYFCDKCGFLEPTSKSSSKYCPLCKTPLINAISVEYMHKSVNKMRTIGLYCENCGYFKNNKFT